jgi:hypothetical protein
MRVLWAGPFLSAVLCLNAACAAEPSPEQDALSIADDAQLTPAKPSDWRIFVEAGAIDEWDRLNLRNEAGVRLSLDIHFETALTTGLRVIFSDRLDEEKLAPPSATTTINTLKEAYLSWQLSPDETLDAGRINLRYGVAIGYNPTDFFKTDAIRSIVSIDPSSLRENRQGSVVLESQTLWEGSSFTALVSPKLATTQDTADFSADWAATNGQNRWLLAASHQFTNDLNPQLILFGARASAPATGLNVSSLLNQSTVAFLEWSGQRAPSAIAQALELKGSEAYRSRAAFGATYTTEFNLSITAEHEMNSAGADQDALDGLVRRSPLALLEYLSFISEAQDLPTRRAEFLYATWQDFTVKHLDLSGFVRWDPISHGRTSWMEARYHFDRADLALQWQIETGQPQSVFGAIPTQREVQILVRYFL